MTRKGKQIATPQRTPTTRGRLSFVTALAAPSKYDRVGQLQAALDQTIKENRALKARLSALEARFDAMIGLTIEGS